MSICGVLAGLFATAPSSAALVYDTITVYDSSKAVIASLVVTQAQQAAHPTATDYLAGIAIDPAEFGNYGIVLAGTTPVDIFGISLGGPDGMDLAFAPGPVAATYPIKNPVPDTGLPISMTMYLSPALQSGGDTAWFTASGAFTENVPEPATWLMMLVAVGGIGFAAARRQKAA